MSIATGRHATVSVEIGGREITFETGKLAKQADGAVVVRSRRHDDPRDGRRPAGGPPRRGLLPADVDVEERMYAAGKIPGGFFKREGKASERATLTARMIDRPIRPLWPKGFRNEVQVICTVLSADMVHGARRPLHQRCLGGARDLAAAVPRPGRRGAHRADRRRARRQPDAAGGGRGLRPRPDRRRHARRADDDRGRRRPDPRGGRCCSAFELAHAEIKRICDVIDDLRAQVGKPKWVDPSSDGRARRARTATRSGSGIQEQGLEAAELDRRRDRRTRSAPTSRSTRPRTTSCVRCRSRRARPASSTSSGSSAVEGPVREQFESDLRELTDAEQDSKELKSRKRDILLRPHHRGRRSCRSRSVGAGESEPARTRSRSPGSRRRPTRSTRTSSARRSPSTSAVPTGAARRRSARSTSRSASRPRTHGSGLFTRGETQILTLCTLGTAKEGQRIDDLSLENDRRYMHHYNFPPYSVGETGFMRGPKRRDIGHGALAQRALEAVIPSAGGLPVHDPPRLRDARVERLVVDGLGLRLDDVDDGRRRADQGAGLRHRDGSRQGGRRLRHPHRHPGRRGSPR